VGATLTLCMVRRVQDAIGAVLQAIG